MSDFLTVVRRWTEDVDDPPAGAFTIALAVADAIETAGEIGSAVVDQLQFYLATEFVIFPCGNRTRGVRFKAALTPHGLDDAWADQEASGLAVLARLAEGRPARCTSDEQLTVIAPERLSGPLASLYNLQMNPL